MNEKLKPHHLDKTAYVYVRQSTMHQVRRHPESRRLQYALKERACCLGFQRTEVIDDDLGVTASGSKERTGFGKVLRVVCEGQAGAVFTVEASRLARNSRDWHHLIDLCALTETVVIDEDGIYDPRNLNDRMLLGMKGQFAEFELNLLRQRAQAALAGMIKRGVLLWHPPIGFIRTQDNRCEMAPDLRIQEAIRSVFSKFQEFGSARQVLLWFRQERIPLPTLQCGGGQNEIRWELPIYSQILSILKNPMYAGAFFHGRTRTRTAIVEGRARKSAGHAVSMDQWKVLIQDHHPGYITWKEFLRNQEVLDTNAGMRGNMSCGAAKSGPAMLAGLLRCGRCGRKFHVTYSGVGGKVPRYHCRGAHVNHGTRWCISFGGLKADEAISAKLMEALQPLGITASLDAWESMARREDEKHRALVLSIEKAEYEVRRAKKQYDSVDPENRLVAAELERRWNSALQTLEEAKTRLQEDAASVEKATEEEKKHLLDLGRDLQAAWHHPQASTVLKKRILRTVVKEIVADIKEDSHEILFHIHWVGGVHTSFCIPKHRTGQHRRTTNHDTVELIRELAKTCVDMQTAAHLNRLGHRTGTGQTWTESRVRSIRSRRGIPTFDPKAPRSWLSLSEAAEHLGVGKRVVERFIRQGLLPARQAIRGTPWRIEASAVNMEDVKKAARASREGSRIPRTVAGQMLIPFEPTT